LFQTLSLSGLQHDFVSLAADLEGIAVDDLPVIEDTLREGLSGSLGAEIGGETERGVYGQVSLNEVERSADLLLLGEDVSTTTIEGGIDTSHGVFRTLDLDQVDGLHEAGLGGQDGGVQDLPGGGDDLTSTSVDGISMEGDIVNVPADTSAVFVTENTFLGGPGKSGDNRVLDFIQVLNTLGDINANIGTAVLIGTEAPNLTSIGGVEVELLSKDTSASLEVLAALNFTLIDGLGKALREGLGSHVQTVVLVRRLGQTKLVRLGGHGLTVGHNRVGGDDFHTRTVLFL